MADTPQVLPTGTVVGRFTAPDGRPVGGSVVFTPSTRVLLGDEIVVGSPVVVKLDAQGTLGEGVKLLATDVAGTRPVGFTYRVSFGRLRVAGPGSGFPPFDIEVPGGTIVDLADVAPVPSSGGTAIIVDPTTALRAERAAARAEAILDDLMGAGGLTLEAVRTEVLRPHIDDPTPHPAYDNMPSLRGFYRNRKAVIRNGE